MGEKKKEVMTSISDIQIVLALVRALYLFSNLRSLWWECKLGESWCFLAFSSELCSSWYMVKSVPEFLLIVSCEAMYKGQLCISCGIVLLQVFSHSAHLFGIRWRRPLSPMKLLLTFKYFRSLLATYDKYQCMTLYILALDHICDHYGRYFVQQLCGSYGKLDVLEYLVVL